MPRITLNTDDVQEIRNAMRGLTGVRATETARDLAKFYDVHISRIYEVSKDVRPERKPRSDKGKRTAELTEHSGLKLAAELVVNQHLKPELALEVAELNGEEVPIATGTFQRYLREKGVSRKQNQSPRRVYRKWQADAPGLIFQFDITGLKVRWLNVKTRQILKLQIDDKNHPNTNKNLVRLWSFVMKDDNSRYLFERFYACDKPNSTHVVDFCFAAFAEMGVPLKLYSDNDAIIVSAMMRRAEKILNKAFETTGGFELTQHAAGNPQATGKVENAHKVVEEFEKLIGVKYSKPGIEELNNFSKWMCDSYNRKTNRATGIQPRVAFGATNAVMRRCPDETLKSAFKAKEFTRVIAADATFSYENQSWQLPRSAKYPFNEWATIGLTATVLWLSEEDYFVITASGYDEFAVAKQIAQADVAGDYKRLPETIGQQTRKILKASAQERKKQLQSEGRELLVMGFDTQVKQDSVVTMPRRTVEADANVLARELPSFLNTRTLTLYQSIEALQDEEIFSKPVAREERLWLERLFAGREEIEETELRAALEERDKEYASSNVVPLVRSA